MTRCTVSNISPLAALPTRLDFRGKVTPGTDFSFSFYGVNDRGIPIGGGQVQKQGGYQLALDGRSALPDGWEARWHIDYLSSFLFREAFSQSFQGTISAESHTVGFVARHWSSFGLDFVVDRDEQFENVNPDDKIIIRKLPEVDFLSRDRQILTGAAAGVVFHDQQRRFPGSLAARFHDAPVHAPSGCLSGAHHSVPLDGIQFDCERGGA